MLAIMVVRMLGGMGTYDCQDDGRYWHSWLSGCRKVLALMAIEHVDAVCISDIHQVKIPMILKQIFVIRLFSDIRNVSASRL